MKSLNLKVTTTSTANYRLLKDKLEFEKYFDILEDIDIFTFCHFRTVNHKLPIKHGRWKTGFVIYVIHKILETSSTIY